MLNNLQIEAIVPTHGAGQAFLECIDSLLAQTYPLQRIIVIDNNVRDGSIQQLRDKYNLAESSQIGDTALEIFSLPDNTGVTGGRNAGIARLSDNFDAALFVDHDMVAEPGMIQQLLATLSRHPEAGIVTPKIYYHDQRNIIWAAGTDINLRTGQTIFYGGEDQGQYDTERQVAVAPATFLVTKKTLQAIGLFDTRYFATYEDTDFCFSAQRAGFQTWYSPKAVTYHKIPFDPQAAMQRLLERTYYVARNRYYFLWKHHLFNISTILYMPLYLTYYTFLAIRYARPSALADYLRGLYDALSLMLLKQKNIPLTYAWIFSQQLSDCKTVLDVGCGHGQFMNQINDQRQFVITGVEYFEEYIQAAKQTGAYREVHKLDILEIDYPPHTFDAVVLSQVIEHLKTDEALALLKKIEQIAVKKVIIATPNGAYEQHEYDNNPLQKHQSSWVPKQFTQLGYKVYGQGWKVIYADHGLYNSPLRHIPGLKYLLFAISFMLSPFIYNNPQHAGQIIAVKTYAK
jgi:GT2 family glycosyltransferase/ubiquinone/menaquinone biosynthesis C-methylase UbiE